MESVNFLKIRKKYDLEKKFDSYLSYFNEAVNPDDIDEAIMLIDEVEKELRELEG